MKNVFLVSYSVQGIKVLDKLVSLSFYKKTISNTIDTQEYNVKGIYGMNGSGKSGIITSVDILKNILTNPGYLNNPIVQTKLDAIINKKLGELFIEADFISNIGTVLIYYRYTVKIAKNQAGKFFISYERLSKKKATSKSDSMDTLFEVESGEIRSISNKVDRLLSIMIMQRTVNLLDSSSMCALFYDKNLFSELMKNNQHDNPVFWGLIILYVFGNNLHVYLDQSDDHRDYLVKKTLRYTDDNVYTDTDIYTLLHHYLSMDTEQLNIISVTENVVNKKLYNHFETAVKNLYKFIHIFKSDLNDIEIDRKEDQDSYICSLIMVYDKYRIHSEFESTGIKKLIKLYAYLKEMTQGGIVFIDEFDSNLHDVYLCALLEYLMSYAKGQLCFTTHNVGPMDILKHNKKSIDFLSIDGNVYPWTTNGNYSPSKLYRNGMIEGSPFNVDSIDFIGILGMDGEDS